MTSTKTIVKQTVTTLEAHYVFIKKLGAGGFGHVWEVMQKADTNVLFKAERGSHFSLMRVPAGTQALFRVF